MDNFFTRSLMIGAGTNSDWSYFWTISTFANWMAWAPITGMFLGKISYGHSIRQFIGINIGAAALCSGFWINIFGGTSIYQQLNGTDIYGAMQQSGTESAVYEMFQALPLGKILIPVLVLTVALSVVTAADSTTNVLGDLCCQGSGNEKKLNVVKVVWGIVTYLILLLFIALMIIPIFWGFLTSWKGTVEISHFPPTIFPEIIDIGNFYKVLFMSNFSTYFVNSVVVTATCVIISTLIAGHAAYALARFRIKHREKIMFAILMTSMVPAVALLIPLYIMSVKAGLYNTRIMLVLVYTAWRTPMLTWILKGFFESAPVAIEEAAMIDGCSRLKTFYKVVVPISQPGIVSSALLTAVYVWNDFLVSFTFVTDEKLRTVSVGLYSYITQYGVQWGELMAAVMVTIIPIIIMFVCLQSKFVDGMAAGAVKG